ncbi:hypothetical protein BKA70DRAFT_230456 [Coprinopsis sp. MPI-PUGE-AT-0042]|nr:hypothetical protein BKA70DRAFT_230456 [Coprinopsis sp. MPI-PUGE-AT-0042]
MKPLLRSLSPNMPTNQQDSHPLGKLESFSTRQIDLLQQAITLLKSHALEAGTNLTRLKSLMAEEEHLDSMNYKRLQRERWLEERRELDATKALWSTCQQAEAIVTNDQAFFDHQSRAKERKHRWYQMQEEAERAEYGTPVVIEVGNEGGFYPLSRSRHHKGSLLSSEALPEVPIPTAELGIPAGNQLIPLALACKADPEALQPKRGSSASSVSSSSTSSSNSTSNLRTPINLASSSRLLEDDELDEEEEEGDDFASGTVTIFRSNGPGTVRKARKPSTSSTFRRLAEEELADVAMPDYVADLLSEFDGQTSVPTLSLQAPSSSFSGLALISPPASVELTRSPSPPPTITSPKSAPSSPVHPRRAVRRMPSTKRISGFFSKRPSMTSLRQSESPYPIHATQIPSRLGSSIDLVIPEESSFGLPLNFEDVGRTSGGFTSPSLSQGNWSSSPTNPSSLNPKRYSDSVAGGVSMLSLMSSQETATSDTTSMPPLPPPLRSAPAASSSSRALLDGPSASATPVAQPPPSPESSRFAARLKKRMSALRF